MNNEIVTYLKGKEDFNDNNFIKEWSNFSSLIQADKDPGQYLPHLFIIYYFGHYYVLYYCFLHFAIPTMLDKHLAILMHL